VRIGQRGIIFFNGECKVASIKGLGERKAILEFYDPRNETSYDVVHPRDSIMLINQGDIEENSICAYNGSENFGGLGGCIVEKIDKEKCTVISVGIFEEGNRIFREEVSIRKLIPIEMDTALSVIHRFSDAHCPEDIKHKALYRECTRCIANVSTINSQKNQFLSGFAGTLTEACLCNSCKELDDNQFVCQMCDNVRLFTRNCRVTHNYRTAIACREHHFLCRPCSRNISICNQCGSSNRRHHILLNDRILCRLCSEDAVKTICRHPERTVSTEHHRISDTFSKIESKRHAGIEIECIHDWGRLSIPSGWRIVSDTSISDGDYGAEYVMTNPHNGDRLLSKVENIVDFIFRTGGYVDDSCGLHIHINGLDMGLREMKNCLAIGKSMETWIYDMLPPSRKSSHYSQPLPEFDVKRLMSISTYSEFVEFWYHTISNTQITTRKYNESRYRGLNVHSRFVNGTIEFRHHHGTLNFMSIEKWIKLCMAVVETSFNMSKDSKEILIDSPLEYSASDFFFAIGLSEFNNHYNNMKEKFKTLKPKESPRTTPSLDPDPFLDAEFIYDGDRHNLGMIEESDSETLRM